MIGSSFSSLEVRESDSSEIAASPDMLASWTSPAPALMHALKEAIPVINEEVCGPLNSV